MPAALSVQTRVHVSISDSLTHLFLLIFNQLPHAPLSFPGAGTVNSDILGFSLQHGNMATR